MRNVLCCFMLMVIGVWSHALYAQDATKSEEETNQGITMMNVSYAYQLPAADLAERFGATSTVGLGVLQQFNNDWIIGVDGQFLFGDVIRQDSLLFNLSGNGSLILGTDGRLADIRLFERGFQAMGRVGKFVPFRRSSFGQSGLLLLMGVGVLQHKISIEEPSNLVPQLKGEYVKGYDRLTNGLMLNQFIGYNYLNRETNINFYIGLDITQGFTRNRRSFQFDTLRSETEPRFEMLYGLRVGWVLPIYQGGGGDYYYN